MIIENEIMWPTVCNSARFDSETRGVYDALLHASYTCVVKSIYTGEPINKDFLTQQGKGVIKFYNLSEKIEIYENYVEPIFESIEKEVKNNSECRFVTIMVFADLKDFLTNLLWCSKLQIPFVYDLSMLLSSLESLRINLYKNKLIQNIGMIELLIEMISLYEYKDTYHLQAKKHEKGNILELWENLRDVQLYKKLSMQHHNLGFSNKNTINHKILTTKKTIGNILNDKYFKASASIAQAGISIMFDPIAKLTTGAIGKFTTLLYEEKYIPVIYSLKTIERNFDEVYNPDYVEYYHGKKQKI